MVNLLWKTILKQNGVLVFVLKNWMYINFNCFIFVLCYACLQCLDLSHPFILCFFLHFLKLEERVGIIGQHLTAPLEGFPAKAPQVQARTRPPITTHVLDVSRGSPAAGIEVRLEMWKSSHPRPSFGETDIGGWVLEGSSTTDRDGRSGQLMSIVDALSRGVYRISFNTGKYNPGGFFPYVSIVFEINDTQKFEHFHVPLLLSPFSFSTYRGS